jgi:hypothetical protein
MTKFNMSTFRVVTDAPTSVTQPTVLEVFHEKANELKSNPVLKAATFINANEVTVSGIGARVELATQTRAMPTVAAKLVKLAGIGQNTGWRIVAETSATGGGSATKFSLPAFSYMGHRGIVGALNPTKVTPLQLNNVRALAQRTAEALQAKGHTAEVEEVKETTRG